MNISFYTATIGAQAQQRNLDIVSNNLVNANTTGYKTQNAGFDDLLYRNIKQLQGSGTRVETSNIDFDTGSYIITNENYDFQINGDGFFALQDPATGGVSYTRDGSFRLSSFMNNNIGDEVNYFLTDAQGLRVLDKEMQPIEITLNEEAAEDIADAITQDPDELLARSIGVFDFISKEGLIADGGNNFIVAEGGAEPYLAENYTLQRGVLEGSNVDMASEFSKMIIAQRAFQLNLRMLTTSDEIEQTINNLR